MTSPSPAAAQTQHRPQLDVPTASDGQHWRIYCQHFYHCSNQTEGRNYPYFVLLLNLLVKEVPDLFKSRLAIRRKEEFILRAQKDQDGLLKANVDISKL